ncbi:tRNA (adenosine(37)-N6)-threonylcarbamoyltransferase complex transferase subunit TsaD [Patescibacteria group bacterium]|nr:tRNA (adenosine(37)-N6)-threonylcarbamoyltransferase complex transferase subunit TsaD [Patescibacteria group bacterium]
MIILGIETSCDETACAVLKKEGNRIQILSNIVASSALLQAKFGGVIPEQAAREQIKSIIPAVKTAIDGSGIKISDIDAIAVTYGPGLIGSLLVGTETAKTLAFLWNKPLVPVNHLLGHFYANWIQKPFTIVNSQLTDSCSQKQTAKSNLPKFPCIGLLVSGGHTDLVLFKNHGKYKYLGGTRDDASGECFDKCARLLKLPYPGGPAIAELAKSGNPKTFNLPRPMINSKDFDFSFSGLKTAVSNLIKEKGSLKPNELANLAASIEEAIIDVLITKTLLATQTYKANQIIIAGGVAANQSLIRNLKLKIGSLKSKTKLFVPPPKLCTDNAVMIAAAAFFNYQPINPFTLQANPSLAL